MITKAAISAVLMLAAASSQAAEAPVFPAGAKSQDDSRVIAFYGNQCERWADDRRLQGPEKQAYVDTCRANGPAIWPVGYEAGGGGGGEE